MTCKYIFTCIIITGLILSAMMILQGCNGKETGVKAKTETLASSAKSEKGSAQLWSENCMRCHNLRNPAAYSDAQWEVSMHRMRVRAGLTAEEHRRILEFLQSSN
jgi:nitrate/TMAO reductase-like tetraheme cytochrome c subunit